MLLQLPTLTNVLLNSNLKTWLKNSFEKTNNSRETFADIVRVSNCINVCLYTTVLTLRLLRRRSTSSNVNTQIHFQNSYVQFFLFYPFQCCLFTMEGGESYKIFEIELKQIKIP